EIAASEESPVPIPSPPPVSQTVPIARRVTRNVVRRGSTESHRVAMPLVDVAQPVEIEAEPPPGPVSGEVGEAVARSTDSDDFMPRTGIYMRPEDAGAPTVAAAPPAELEAAIEESVDRDEPGSNPLVDVFADLGLEEPQRGAPSEPLTGDLSIDLEGEVDQAAWSDEPVASLEEQLFSEGEAEEGAAETEAAIDAALAEPIVPAGREPRAEEEATGAPTVGGPTPIERGGDPPIDPSLFKLPESGPPLVVTDESQALADLEREIEHLLGLPVGESAPGRSARLHLYAGIAAQRAGDHERAIEHLDEACHADDRSLAAVRALRRILLARGHFQEALRWLDHELELAGPSERDALAAFRADLLLAVRQPDLPPARF